MAFRKKQQDENWLEDAQQEAATFDPAAAAASAAGSAAKRKPGKLIIGMGVFAVVVAVGAFAYMQLTAPRRDMPAEWPPPGWQPRASGGQGKNGPPGGPRGGGGAPVGRPMQGGPGMGGPGKGGPGRGGPGAGGPGMGGPKKGGPGGSGTSTDSGAGALPDPPPPGGAMAPFAARTQPSSARALQTKVKKLWDEGAAAKHESPPDFIQARAKWQEILRLKPDHPGIKQAIDKLNEEERRAAR